MGDYLKQNLVIGKIVEVMDAGRVKIDAGKAKGIELGGVLAVQGRENYRPRFLFVASVEDESCIAKEPEPEPAEPRLTIDGRIVEQGLALQVLLEPAQEIRHTSNRAGVGEQQGGTDQFGVVCVDRHVVGDPVESGSFDSDASITRAISQFV